jgi:hypothetical protein
MTTAILNDYIESLGLEYKATFVPFHESRNRAEKNLSINWEIVLKKGDHTMKVDYSQGIGHIPKDRQDFGEHNKREAEQQYSWHGKYYVRNKLIKVKPPSLADVLYSLALDSEAIDYTFEEWCGNLGYDSDSRKAESIYKSCLKEAIELKQLVPDLNQLREMFQDY